jgi:hypothetical protein
MGYNKAMEYLYHFNGKYYTWNELFELYKVRYCRVPHNEDLLMWIVDMKNAGRMEEVIGEKPL